MKIDQIKQWEDENDVKDGTSFEEKLFLYSLIRHAKPDKVLEVGVSGGGATAWIAGALEDNDNGKLISVDDWSRNYGGRSDGPDAAHARLEDLELDTRVELISESSHDYLPRQDKDAFDVSWIDGDHSYEGAKSDLEEAIRVTDGTVIFHDVTHADGPEQIVAERADGIILPNFQGFYLVNTDFQRREGIY